MLRKTAAALALGVSIAVAPAAAAAQQGGVARVGWLSPGAPHTHGHHLQAFKQGLIEHGYEPGRTILVTELWAEGDFDRVPELARRLAAERVRAIVVGSTPLVLRVRGVTSSIPIIHATGVDPVREGLAASLSRPGGNVTGITTLSETLVQKMTDVLREAIPAARHLCVIHNPDNTNDAFFVGQVRKSAAPWARRISDIPVRAPEDLAPLAAALRELNADAVVVLPDPVLLTLRRELVRQIAQARLPAMFPFSEFVLAGGLMSYGVYLPGNYRRAANFVHRVLEGTPPGELPVEQPSEFEMLVNREAARQLGLAIPPAILMRATRIVD